MFDKIYEIALDNNVTVITSNVRESNKSSFNSLIKSGFEVNNNVNLFYPDGEKKIALFKKIK